MMKPGGFGNLNLPPVCRVMLDMKADKDDGWTCMQTGYGAGTACYAD